MSEIVLPPSGVAEDILSRIERQASEMQIVTFSMGEEYGVPIGQVQEIIRINGVTRVPNSPSYMEGVINLRGKVLPVLNLRKRLKLSSADITKASRIVVTEVNAKPIGLLVDSVSHVVKVSSGDVEQAPEEVLEVDTDYITGVARLKEQLIILLDLERLLRRDKVDLHNGDTLGE